MKLTLATVSIIEDGCFSVLLNEQGWPLVGTCERTFEDVRPVIPAGSFRCERRMFNHGGYMTFEIMGIPGHSLVLFHKGNTEVDSLACVLLGMKFGALKNLPAVLESQAAFDLFWTIAGGVDAFDLDVIGR